MPTIEVWRLEAEGVEPDPDTSSRLGLSFGVAQQLGADPAPAQMVRHHQQIDEQPVVVAAAPKAAIDASIDASRPVAQAEREDGIRPRATAELHVVEAVEFGGDRIAVMGPRFGDPLDLRMRDPRSSRAVQPLA